MWGGESKGLVPHETTGAPILLRAFFKGSKVKQLQITGEIRCPTQLIYQLSPNQNALLHIQYVLQLI